MSSFFTENTVNKTFHQFYRLREEQNLTIECAHFNKTFVVKCVKGLFYLNNTAYMKNRNPCKNYTKKVRKKENVTIKNTYIAIIVMFVYAMGFIALTFGIKWCE